VRGSPAGPTQSWRGGKAGGACPLPVPPPVPTLDGTVVEPGGVDVVTGGVVIGGLYHKKLEAVSK
jgi:hypothetical protein